MENNLQVKFTELKNKIENNNLLKARYEANLEQKEAELKATKKELTELVGTSDEKELETLMAELDKKVEELTKEAQEILSGIEV